MSEIERADLLAIVEAARSRKALDARILDLTRLAAFTDFFVIFSGTNPRQVQAIADAIVRRLKEEGTRPGHLEGYRRAEWVLIDYTDVIVHVFSPEARDHYALEKLWHDAKLLTPPPDVGARRDVDR